MVVWNGAGMERERQEVFSGADHYLGRCALATWAGVHSCLSHQASISDLLSAVLWEDCSELRVPASTVQRLYWALIKAKVVIVLLGGERGVM